MKIKGIRKNLICAILVGIMLSSVLLMKPVTAEEPAYQNISVQQAKHMIEYNENIVILDVRNQSEYNLGHLCNAMLVPLSLLDNASLGWLQTINGSAVRPNVNDTIVVYCLGGSRSEVACEMLANRGFTNVYNMLGGIDAWMSADYPISTTYHTVAFDITGEDTEVYIEPYLETECGCNQSDSQACSDPQLNSTRLVLEDIENHTIVQIQQEYNGSQYEYTVDKTKLWSYSNVTDQINRTVTFTSVVVTDVNGSLQFFSLREDVEKTDSYNMTLVTMLIPLDADTYNTSFTYLTYLPAGATTTETVESIETNSTVTLSQLYASLGTVAHKLGKDYGHSADESLHKFESRYTDIADETKILSQLVETHLSEYDKEILTSRAIIVDDVWWCIVCTIALDIVFTTLTCAAAIACLPGLGETICGWILSFDLGSYPASYVCEEFFDCWNAGAAPYFYGNTVYDTYTYGTGYIQNANYILGSSGDNNGAMMFAGGSGDQAMIYVNPNYAAGEYVHGNIQVLARSYTGIYSVVYVYVWNEATSQWVSVGTRTINPSASYSWYDFGYTNICFRNMLFAVYNGGSASVAYLDAIRITP